MLGGADCADGGVGSQGRRLRNWTSFEPRERYVIGWGDFTREAVLLAERFALAEDIASRARPPRRNRCAAETVSPRTPLRGRGRLAGTAARRRPSRRGHRFADETALRE